MDTINYTIYTLKDLATRVFTSSMSIKTIGSKEPLLAGVLFDDVSQLSNSSSFCFASASPDTMLLQA